MITNTVTVPVLRRWPSGSVRGTGVRRIQVPEEPTVCGGMRAITQACAQVGSALWLDGPNPDIVPNPAEQGWPILP